MYLWKYWRESRIAVVIGILVLAGITAMSFNGHGGGIENPRAYAGVLYVLLFATAGVLALFAWAMGSFGMGRSLGEGAGAFLLTRPRSRSWFVWRDWSAGLGPVALFVALTNVLEGWDLYRGLQAGGAPAGQMLLHGSPEYASLVHSLSLNAVSIFLFCGIVFGVIYLATIALKNALGIIVGAGVLAGYVILGALLDHYTGHQLPDLLQRVFLSPQGGPGGLVDHLSASLAIRAGIVVLFPVAAQLILERSDI
jgi:hypothetical protein